MKKLTRKDFLEIGSGLLLFGMLINNFPIPMGIIVGLEYSNPELDITGRGRCRIENSLPVERGWIYVGDTQNGIHVRGLTEDFRVVENTCFECKFTSIERVYKVDREKVYLIYPEVREVKCQHFVFKSKDDISINDEYQACLRELHYQGLEPAEVLPKTSPSFLR